MTSPRAGGAWVRWSENLGGIRQHGWRWNGPGEPTCDAPACDPGLSDEEDGDGHQSDDEQRVRPTELSAVEKGLSEVAAQVTSINNHLNSTQATLQVMVKDHQQLKPFETSVTEAQQMLLRLGAKLEELKAEAAASARRRLAASETTDSDYDDGPLRRLRPRLGSDDSS